MSSYHSSRSGNTRRGEGSSGRDAVWDVLGRHTAAGKALHNLYATDVNGKSTGTDYSARNRARYEKRLKQGLVPSTGDDILSQATADSKPGHSKPRVAVPKFRKRYGAPSDPDELDEQPPAYMYYHRPGKKPADVIIAELDAENERLWRLPAPAPNGPLLDDAEKARLAKFMEYRGAPPEVTAEDYAKYGTMTKQAQKPKTRRQQLEDLFDEIVREIDDRRAFLDEMTALGKGGSYTDIIKGQISSKVKELKDLDAKIQALPPDA